MLENFNGDWINAGPERKAIYTNLDPGEYVFRVKASNNDGIWNEQGTAVRIIITPPFWNTWWFLAIVLAMITLAAYIILSNRRKTEIKKIVARKREELNQMQLEFFTNISHEVRTPLTLITGPLEKLMKDGTQAEAQPYYRLMHKNAQRLLALINELMDFRKVEEGILKLRAMPGSLSSFLKEIAEEFDELAVQKHIRFETKGLEQQEELWFDRQVLEKIVLNLLYNSFKYTSGEGHIGVELLASLQEFKPKYKNELIIRNEYRAKSYRYIRVWDTGIGISKESIQHLFERYYRVNDTHLGSGIGLAFVKSLTALHKGDIYVYSERKQGTEIIIGLPADKQDYSFKERWLETEKNNTHLESISGAFDLPAITEPVHVNAKDIRNRNYHILVVDDNDELRNFLKENLESYYNISEAQNGLVALNFANR
jgi:signal transduction histidine kinase